MNKRSAQNQNNLFYLLRYLKPYTGSVVLTLVFVIIAEVAATYDPLYLKNIIDYIIGNVGNARISGPILSLLIIYFSLRVGTFFFQFLRDYIFAPVEMGVGRNVARDVFDYLLRLPISFHHDQKTGALARQIARGAQSINFILDFLVINILPTFFDLVFATILLLRLYPAKYGLITLFTIILYTLFTVVTTELRQKYRLAANIADDETSAIQIETITNIDTVKYFGNEKFQRGKFMDRIKKWYDLSVRSNQLFAVISAGQSLILIIGFGLIAYFAVKQSLLGTLTIGDLVLLTSYIVRLAAPIGVLGFVYRRIKDGLTDLASMSHIFTNPIELEDPPNAITLKNPVGSVEFVDVYFDYDNRPALKVLNLKIPAGKRIAIVGPSGAGKSTIVKLLFRLYDPKFGEVRIDGVDIKKIKKEQRHELVVLVPQETILFNDTIAHNIRFGKPDASDAEVIKAIELAHLSDLIRRLPEGLDTVVGERGVKLSGGEKQRVAIARAIIKKPKILVFDEATSNLDAESEQEILKAIREVSSGRTTISIAHRLPTITDSDIIFVVDGGKLVEGGTHQELLKKNGVYARLWKQFVK